MNNWEEVNHNLQEWRKNRKSPPNFELYRKIVDTVGLGKVIADVGCGQQHLQKCLPDGHDYIGIDPFPIMGNTVKRKAEELVMQEITADTTFMLASLDNVENVSLALKGLKAITRMNIVILTGINIEPDKYHTHKITREMLYKELGKPLFEKEMLPNVFLFEWLVS